MITLTLLHPIQSVPVQTWTFEDESVIRIGRSADNHVVLYSAVVSRHHVELRQVASGWEVVNLGANGTYLDGKRITQIPVQDGVIIRLARSGPNVQIHLGSKALDSIHRLAGEETLAQRAKQRLAEIKTSRQPDASPPQLDPISSFPHLPQTRTDIDDDTDGSKPDPYRATLHEPFQEASQPPSQPSQLNRPDSSQLDPSECCRPYLHSDQMFCLHCGRPLRVLGTVGNYQILRVLSQDGIALEQLAWRDGHTYVLMSLNSDWEHHAAAVTWFKQESVRLLALHHPGLPRFVDFVEIDEFPYLLMEPVYGQSLQHFVEKQGSVGQSQAIAWMLQVCDALTSLHQQSPPILHQAINPHNLIQQPGYTTQSITLVSFLTTNAALNLDEQASSQGYTAPEQQQGHPTPASDIYALGPTLAYLLTGRPPSDFYTQREQGFCFCPDYIPGLAPELVPILRKLTSPEPGDRYASPADVADALRQITSLVEV